MYNKVDKFVEKEALIQVEENILLAFSSGPDSVALLECLLRLKGKYNIKIGIAHINHMLRGENSDEDEKFAEKISNRYNIPFYLKREDISAYSQSKKIGIEEAGREVRYNFFNEIREKYGYNKVALAHNLDDNVETFLFRLMRGTSIEGLKGIPIKREFYIRPLLEIKKSEIMKFIFENKLEYRVDESNEQNIYTRNKIRLDLIPYIEENFNPKFKDKITELIKEIENVSENKAEVLGDKIEIKFLKEKSEFDRKNLVAHFLKQNNIEISRNKVDEVVALIDSNGHKELLLGSNKVIVKTYKNLAILKHEEYMITKEKVKSTNLRLDIGGFVEFRGSYIYAEEMEKFDNNKISKDKNIYFIDREKLQEDYFTVRTKEDGDIFMPLGMKNNKKVKEFFIDNKIDRELRCKLPLITNKGEIVWIGGVRGSEKYKISNETKKIIKLTIKGEQNFGRE